MMKAASRHDTGIDFDAQAAAREAARREGKSLGEWLHDVIADHAADRGMGQGQIAGRDRVDAVTSRLERLSGRSSEPSRKAANQASGRARPAEGRTGQGRLHHPRSGQSGANRPTPSGFGKADPAPWRARFVDREMEDWVEDPEALLEEAVTLMERRAAQSDARTEEAFASLAKMMETSESRRALEHEAVTALAHKMASLEGKLTQQFAAGENPLRGALARLEARLDLIGTRSAAEHEARNRAVGGKTIISEDASGLSRLEDKLNSILNAVQDRASVPTVDDYPVAPQQARRPEIAPGRRSLSEAIAEIARRQQVLDQDEGMKSSAARGADPSPSPAGRSDARFPGHDRALDDMRREIAALSQTLQEALSRVALPNESVPAVPANSTGYEASRPDDVQENAELRRKVGSLEQEIRDLADRLDGPRRAGSGQTSADPHSDQESDPNLASAGSPPTGDEPSRLVLDSIEQRLVTLSDKIDEARLGAAVPAPAPVLDTRALEGLVRELGERMEAAQAPSAGPVAIEALQKQIERLADRFSRSEQGLSALPVLTESVRDLFKQLETTQATVESSAAQAARDVMRVAMNEERARQPADGAASELAALKSLQESADLRTRSTLNSVHDVLEKVVDRLSSVEDDLANVRTRPGGPSAPEPAAAVQRPPMPKPARLSGQDRSPDLSLDGMKAVREPAMLPTNGRRSPSPLDEDADGPSPHATYIEAARRAARVAKTEASIAALRQPPGVTPADKAARADLLGRSRDFVATHKRPVLMGLAAILMVLGTIAMLQRAPFGAGEQVAATASAPRIKTAAVSELPRAPRAKPASTLGSDELSPSALPKASAPLANPIPGSDPIQTASIPSLPAFAARAPAAPIPLAALPAGLKVAAEAGNGDAAYELGVRYSDGQGVVRDSKLAAQWFAKAADQGLAPAQYRLASMYEKGLGVAQDKVKAKDLYTLAANAGNPRAMHNLAVMVADGDGRPDYATAAGWFRKAANYGVHDSQYNLAILLARGLGVQQSLVQSYQWFAIAAQANDVDAAHKRDEVGAKMNPSDLAVGKALAAAFQPKSATASAVGIEQPAGGWDSVPSASHLNSAKSKVSSL